MHVDTDRNGTVTAHACNFTHVHLLLGSNPFCFLKSCNGSCLAYGLNWDQSIYIQPFNADVVCLNTVFCTYSVKSGKRSGLHGATNMVLLQLPQCLSFFFCISNVHSRLLCGNHVSQQLTAYGFTVGQLVT